MFETIALTFIVIAAGFLQGLTGFGFVLIALPLLDFFIPFKIIVPLVIMLALCISLILSIQLRNSIQFKRIGILFLATLPGIPLGVNILQHISAGVLSVALGIIMVSFTAYQLWANPSPRPLSLHWTLIAGFLSGILTSSIAAGGPPVIVYSTMQPSTKDEGKASLAFYFFISGLAVCGNQAIDGFITSEVINLFLTSLPALIVGIFLGTFAYKHISDNGYRKLAFILVFLLGCMMIYKNF